MQTLGSMVFVADTLLHGDVTIGIWLGDHKRDRDVPALAYQFHTAMLDSEVSSDLSLSCKPTSALVCWERHCAMHDSEATVTGDSRMPCCRLWYSALQHCLSQWALHDSMRAYCLDVTGVLDLYSRLCYVHVVARAIT